VAPINDAPTALDDAYDTAEDLPLDVEMPGVLGNDDDVDGDALSSVLVTGPTRGTLTLQSSGAFRYSPNANQSGADSFTYRAVDPSGASSAITTVAITVAAVPDAPIAANDSYTVANTAALNVTAPGVLGNDADADGDALGASLVTGPAVGTLTLNANGSFSYTPQSGHVGTVTFTYRASDGTLTDDATVTISVTGSAGGGGGCCLIFGEPIPEIFDFESYNGFPATPGHIGRETLGDVEVEILGPWWLE
jgi:VCBS repeat-containing protein